MEPKIVTLATFSSISDAYVFKNILDMAGIENFVVDSNAPLVPSVPAAHDGGIKINVKEDDAAKAISILNQAKEHKQEEL